MEPLKDQPMNVDNEKQVSFRAIQKGSTLT